jgi:PAS domain S-box-containing protein
MQYRFSDLIDIDSLKDMMEAACKLSGVAAGILDSEGNILAAMNYYEICTEFHQANPVSCSLCRLSDNQIRDYVSSHSPYSVQRCPHNLYSAAIPVMIGETHLATVFAGQYLTEPADIEMFRKQASLYGYDEAAYLAALRKVPVLGREQINYILTIFQRLTYMLVQMASTQRRQMDLQHVKLRESEEKYHSIVNNMPNVAIQSYNSAGRILYWNKASETMYGWRQEEVRGKSLEEIMLDDRSASLFRKLIRAANILKRPVGPAEWRIRDKDGKEKCLISTIFAIQSGASKEYICMDMDVTDRKYLERELARFDRLNLIGQLAASIGHEVRNPMTTVRGYLQFLRNKDETQAFWRQLDVMIEEIDRANSIIREFLTLAKNKTIHIERKNLNDVINALALLLDANALVDGTHRLQMCLEPLPDLLFDEKEMRQLILNLARNGLEAMPDGGCLTIRTYVEGQHAILAVADEGTGISETVLERLGTPFVTTKDNGTGLGLAVCYSIAARHKVQIKVDTGPGGTTFYLWFRIPKADDWTIDEKDKQQE